MSLLALTGAKIDPSPVNLTGEGRLREVKMLQDEVETGQESGKEAIATVQPSAELMTKKTKRDKAATSQKVKHTHNFVTVKRYSRTHYLQLCECGAQRRVEEMSDGKYLVKNTRTGKTYIKRELE